MNINNQDTINEMLEQSDNPHLSLSFSLLPFDVQKGISTMVTEMTAAGRHHLVIQESVISDVSAALEGTPSAQLLCFKYIHSANQTVGSL